MRTGRRIRAVLAAAVACLVAAGTFAVRAHAGGETALDKYQILLQEKRSLLREYGLLQQESAVAATKNPYIFFHLGEPKLEFRVRGRAMKAYAFAAMAFDERARHPADPEALWKKLGKPLTVLEVEGGHPELIPLDPNAAAQTGQLFSDPNQLASQTGAPSTPMHSDAGVLGVDVPTDYYIKFEEDVVIHIRTPKTLTLSQKAADRFDEISGNLGALWSRWWTGKDPDQQGKPRLDLYLTTDPDTAKNLHYSLLPGEKIFVVPPPPPPIQLVAGKGADPSEDRPASKVR